MKKKKAIGDREVGKAGLHLETRIQASFTHQQEEDVPRTDFPFWKMNQEMYYMRKAKSQRQFVIISTVCSPPTLETLPRLSKEQSQGK